ncbi:MAG: zinc ABC transporter substrate-binding protein [bacterium]
MKQFSGFGLAIAAAWAAMGLIFASPAAGAPEVVVSIKPIHSLVASVMAGAGAPRLLVSGAASPHTYSLKPSGARALRRARLVFWVGGGIEKFLEKPLKTLARNARVVDVSRIEGLFLLPARRGGVWEYHEPEGGEGGGPNPHVWLDPENAQAIVRSAADALAGADPGNARVYRANGRNTIRRLGALDRELRAKLGPVARTPYMVFHDAYPYFERRYGLSAAGSVTVSPARPPGARRLIRIRARLRARGAICVFAEPGFRPALIRTLVAGTGARAGVLDPLGAAIEPGPDMYFSLMRGLAASLSRCLAPPRSTGDFPLK